MLLYFTLLLTSKLVLMTRRSFAELEGQLYQDLLYDYNKIPRPIKNSTDVLTVNLGASLIRIIDVDEKNQILTTNLWLEMQWNDSKLTWDPSKYGGITTLHIPSDQIWTPDLVLYNNAAGDPDITIFTDALVAYDGRVLWQPPAIYKSFCPIDVTWFPYDSQQCEMKFGAWSYTGYYVDLKQLPQDQVMNGVDKYGQEVETMKIGMDLSFFYQSAEWDLLSLSSARHSVLYISCCGPEKYVDITYYFVLHRKTLFFTCNLIVPCFLISFLTTTVFYLTDHKITFSISILVTLTVFFLVLIDIMPPTSLVIPMFGRYLITTMILVSLSTVVSVITVNFRFRSGSAYRMSPWIRKFFLHFLPKILFIERNIPKRRSESSKNKLADALSLVRQQRIPPNELYYFTFQERKHMFRKAYASPLYPSFYSPSYLSHWGTHVDQSVFHKNFICRDDEWTVNDESFTHQYHCFNDFERYLSYKRDIISKLLQQIRFIANHFQINEEEAEISDEWIFVAMVLDRLFLIIFSVLNFGTFLILVEAPLLYDTTWPINITQATKPLGQGSFSLPTSKYFK
uniref:Neur_chan_LBD domain-containing protein n=1 Tax=Elaeophora elaphi TaxID=1147741 RepID=A0A0R3S0J7_9BILA